MNRRRLVFAAFFLVALLWAALVYRDLGIEERGIVSDEGPELVVRGIELEREISGDIWVMSSETAERYGGLDRLESIAVRVETASGGIWIMEAPSGTVTHDAGEIELYDVAGRTEEEERPFSWEAPSARWSDAEEEWSFPEGVVLWDESVHVRGETASFIPGGMMKLDRGAVARWELD